MPQPISNISQLTAEAIAAFAAATKRSAARPGDQLERASTTVGITQATGLVWYDLQTPAKNLFPVLTPLRNKIPRVPGSGGTATNWKVVTAVNATGVRGGVPEGTRNGVLSTTEDDRSATYKSLGLENYVTFEADLAAEKFEPIRATTAQRLLWATMLEEELFDLGGNAGVALGKPTAPTVTTAPTGGTIADGTYNVMVVALSLHGALASSVAGGVKGQISVTPADGSSAFTYGGGSSNKSDATSTGAISGTGANVINATVPVVAGAVAYAWYVGAAGSETLQAITKINSVKLTALTTDKQAATAITADYSKNALGYDGLLYQAWTSGSGAYIKALATGTAGTGTSLTYNGQGGIVEFDEAFLSLWDNYKITPTHIWVSSQEMKSINKLILGATSPAVVQMWGQMSDSVSQRQALAGATVRSILNPFYMGGVEVPVDVHPNLPAGTVLMETDLLPYPVNNVPNVYEKRLRRDYYQMEWPLRSRKYETGVYFDGVLAHYFPPSMAIISNIAPAA